ncbi:hypothetical protein RND71_040008 [Anisodus tanguticus]|uniref:O-GlcNAc transferase C-terminal domain-containing protein n=1 Tax=Anisodus tanguticus TaxID=243964 RepID=A0AAE1R0M8_9SOLA|nr:hypothetical protein RND71_040008 [Anisodus tanguticus]
MFIEVEGILRRQIKMSVIPSVQPFHAIAYPLDPILALDIIRKYARHCSVIEARHSLPPFTHPPPLPIKGGGRTGRLRVGYVSSDFGNHRLSHLMGSVFGMHDKGNVEVQRCYFSLSFALFTTLSLVQWRIRTQTEAEHFIDVSSLTTDVIARMINEDQIQILINLNGYTKGARNEIFSMQPAPIQVSYMGFPGTTGATYIDYLVTDEFVSPMKYTHIYSEKLVHLPHCYFVNDYKQCNILKRVPNSALWLLRFPAAGEMRLRAHAAAQALQPDQIIFTDACNAHTTGTDVLWAGLPMITLPLEKMATRVAGSLCLATGHGDEMIVSSMKEYEEKAVSLALNRPKLQDLTNRLKAVRMSCPLFDTIIKHIKFTLLNDLLAILLDSPEYRWVRNLERSYFKMWNLYCSGHHPQPFKVTENDSEFPFDC